MTEEVQRQPMLGEVETFDPDKHDFEVWLELFELFCSVNAIKGDQQRSLFLIKIGMATYTDLRALCGAKAPQSVDYGDLKKKIENKLKPKPSEVAERSKFRARVQRENESVLDFVVELQKLSRTCNFGDALEENWRDGIVHGVLDKQLQTKLFDEPYLTFRKTMEILQAWEGTRISLKAEVETLENVSTMGSTSMVHAIRGQNQKLVRKEEESELNAAETNRKCSCCGYTTHEFKNCKFKEYNCNTCGRKGHLQKVCFKNMEVKSGSNGESKEKNQNSLNKISNDDFFLGSLF